MTENVNILKQSAADILVIIIWGTKTARLCCDRGVKRMGQALAGRPLRPICLMTGVPIRLSKAAGKSHGPRRGPLEKKPEDVHLFITEEIPSGSLSLELVWHRPRQWQDQSIAVMVDIEVEIDSEM
jgi:hypothetical protein